MKPNILFLFTDQQNSSMMSCTGNQHLNTPNIDSIAARGVRFTRAYCTNPVCVPSRFSLMTGRMPGDIGMISNAVHNINEVPCDIRKNGLGFLMQKAGYDAVYAGKVHLPQMTAEDVGFKYLCNDERDILADTCAKFIKSRNSARPFCLVASFINPHDICYMALRDDPINNHERRLVERGKIELKTLDKALKHPPAVDEEEFFARYCPPLPENFEPQVDEPEAIRILLEQRPFRMSAREKWSARRWREHRWAYARLTERADAQIGRVLEALEDSGQRDNTVIVFTSDHGDMDAAHKMEHKGVLYDESCRIPLIISAPDVSPAVPSEQKLIVSNGLDILPTLCDYAEIPPPEDLSGISLRQILNGRRADSDSRTLPVESPVGRAVITERYKYAVYDLGETTEQVTDIASDPGETGTVTAKAGLLQEDIEKLRAEFRKHFGEELRNPKEVFAAASAG